MIKVSSPSIIVARGNRAQDALRFLETNQADGLILVAPNFGDEGFNWSAILDNTDRRIRFLCPEKHLKEGMIFYQASGLPVN